MPGRPAGAGTADVALPPDSRPDLACGHLERSAPWPSTRWPWFVSSWQVTLLLHQSRRRGGTGGGRKGNGSTAEDAVQVGARGRRGPGARGWGLAEQERPRQAWRAAGTDAPPEPGARAGTEPRPAGCRQLWATARLCCPECQGGQGASTRRPFSPHCPLWDRLKTRGQRPSGPQPRAPTPGQTSCGILGPAILLLNCVCGGGFGGGEWGVWMHARSCPE